MSALDEIDYQHLARNPNQALKKEQERTRRVEQWLVHGAPPGLFERVILAKCTLRKQQLRQLLLFAAWVPPVIHCRCYQKGVNGKLRMLHWPCCLEDKRLSRN